MKAVKVVSDSSLGTKMWASQFRGFRSAAVPAADIEKFVRDDERMKNPGEADIDRTQSKLFRLRGA